MLSKTRIALYATWIILPQAPALLATTIDDSTTEYSEFAALSDAEIAGVVNVVNAQIIESGHQAQRSASNPKLSDYATNVIKESQRFNQEFSGLLNKFNIEGSESMASAEWRLAGMRDRTSLAFRSGTDFDRHFLHQQLKFLSNFIETLDNNLIPAAGNPEIKAYLQAMRGDVAKEIEAGKALQAEIGE